MQIIRTLILSFLTVFALQTTVLAQHSDLAKYQKQLTVYQDSLKTLGNKIYNEEAEAERYNANYAFIKTLVRALKTPNSFNFGFDSLKMVSVVRSVDSRFKIFSWNVKNSDGTYRYYGTIQLNTGGKLTLLPLIDNTPLTHDLDTITTNNKWYGAQYYEVIPVTYNVKEPYYILLGWKGNNAKSTKKIIDVLRIKDNKAIFGMPVFDGVKNTKNKNRIIFEYTSQASMNLRFNNEKGTIIFDHLAPPSEKLKNQFELYGPDLSYDGLKLVNGRWKLVENIEMRNAPSSKDNNFNDPTKIKLNKTPIRSF